MGMITPDDFLASIEAHLKQTGTSASRFGREVVGDPNFVSDLRDGRKPNLALAGKVFAFIKAREEATDPVSA